MKFNINLIDAHVLGQFNQIRTEDGLWLYQFEKHEPPQVAVSPVQKDWEDNQTFNVRVFRESRTIETIVCIMRTSANYYTVNGYKKGKTFSKRCSNIEDVSNYIKTNFCKTLIK